LDPQDREPVEGRDPGMSESTRVGRAGIRRPAILALLAGLGPGLIAASAGNDAGGIATYASVGAEYGFALLWALALITISLAIVQEMVARMGVVTGKGFSDLVREQFGVRITALIMLLLVIANAGLVASEFAGIGAAAELFGVEHWVAAPLMAVLLWLLIQQGSYARVERVFLWLALVFLTYPISAVLSHPDWGEVAGSIVTPHVEWSAHYLTLFMALVGTTITPYMQLYLQSAVAEKSGMIALRNAQIDAYSGAIFSNLIAGTIVIATGATLFLQGKTVTSADAAARALEPLAGRAAPYVFGAGLFGASTLAAAVLPLATAYAVCEAFGFERGVDRSFREAPVFQGLFTGLIAIGAMVAMIPQLDVIKLLVSTQVLNGLVLPIVLVSIVRLANSPDVLTNQTNTRLYNLFAWATVGFVALLSTVYLIITLLGIVGVT
jgi:Mn2+/Fe2+ NRAMP family transporter